ncbi:MAG: hypothetical protein JXA99_00225 [Candidatus Lokiarchaeota archaeon]|nr:hypothetical protein [Candidatus Lokiarchaeota archaeon]
MSIKKEVVYYNRTLFNDLRRAIIEHRAKDYEAHIKEILKINRKKVGF